MASVWITKRRLVLARATHTSPLEVNKVHINSAEKNSNLLLITDAFQFTGLQRPRQNLIILKEIVCLISVMFFRPTLLLLEDDILFFLKPARYFERFPVKRCQVCKCC